MVSGRRGEAGAPARKPVGVESKPEHATVLIQPRNMAAVIVRVSRPQHRRAIRITALVRFVHVCTCISHLTNKIHVPIVMFMWILI